MFENLKTKGEGKLNFIKVETVQTLPLLESFGVQKAYSIEDW
jgi:hypothetical protein